MEKLDLTKHYKTYYSAKSKPEIIEIGEAQFLAVEGKGDPSEKQYADKIQALYATAYAIKFLCKASGKDFTVAKLEGLWSFDEKHYKNMSITEAPVKVPRSEWSYKMMIRMPDYIIQDQVTSSIEAVVTKKKIPLAKDIELFTMTEGKVVQMLHNGPFSTEPETLQQLQHFIEKNGFEKNGLHHEIYLSDYNKSAPEKLKTILREPVK
jgi:hypothetical protein